MAQIKKPIAPIHRELIYMQLFFQKYQDVHHFLATDSK